MGAKPHCRTVEGLLWARLCNRPKCIPKGRAKKGVKALGLQYESRAQKALLARFPGALCGQWIEYCDKNGHGYAQPDAFVVGPGEVAVFECKLTETEEGRVQIKVLYKPLLEKIFGLPVRGVVVAKHLTRETRPELVKSTLVAALSANMQGLPTLHWLGWGSI